MKNIFKTIGTIVAIVFLFITSAAVASTLRVVQTPTYHLYTGESGSATSMRIVPYPIDLDGTKLTMTDFGTSPSVTVDPKVFGIEEIETFTGITDNGDGTATLTGLTRNLLSKYPYTTAGTGRTHGSGATVVFGNNPQLYGRLAAPENVQTWTAVQTYASTSAPRYDADPGAAFFTTAPTTVFVNLAQLTRTSIAGATNASISLQGLLQVATPIQAASSTALGSSGAYLALTSSIATSTCQTATSSVITAQTSGKIATTCLDLAAAYTWSGRQIFGTASTTFNATTSIAASTSSPLFLNGISYAFQSVRAASSTILMENGLGSPIFSPSYARLICSSITDVGNTGTASTTVLSCTLPAGVLTPTGVLHIHGNYDTFGIEAANTFGFGVQTASTPLGFASSTVTSQVNKAGGPSGSMDAYITGKGTATTQETDVMYQTYGVDLSNVGLSAARTQQSSFDITSSQTIILVTKFSSSGSQTNINFHNGYMEVIN